MIGLTLQGRGSLQRAEILAVLEPHVGFYSMTRTMTSAHPQISLSLLGSRHFDHFVTATTFNGGDRIGQRSGPGSLHHVAQLPWRLGFAAVHRADQSLAAEQRSSFGVVVAGHAHGGPFTALRSHQHAG